MKYSIRTVLVVALVALQLAAVATILLSSYLTSERVLMGHVRDLMLDVANQTIQHSVNFLEPAQEAADLSQRLAQQDVINSENAESLEKYFFEQLRSYDQFSGVLYGNNAGAFVYVKHDDSVAGAAYKTKIISVEGGERQVTLKWRDSEFNLVARETDPKDPYDPRTRPWYQRALELRGVSWTEPYIFYTSRNPGISVGAPVLDGAGAVKGVVGVDIEIIEISDFLAGLKVGKSGRAFIVNRNGDVLAHPEPSLIKMQKSDGSDGLRFTRIDEIDDPVSRAAFRSLWASADSLDVARPIFTNFDLEGETYNAVFAPLPERQWPWVVGIHVPENDFLGTIKENRRDNIIVALLIAAVTAGIGLLLARSITRPIAALYSQANRIARGTWPQMRDFASSYRELSRAGMAFNRMAAWLDGYKADNERLTGRLRAASRELEVRVEERTAALTIANEHLKDEIEQRKVAQMELAQEVTQHKETCRALQVAHDHANAANQAKSRFLSNMSHELRTPMNVIMGYSELLKRASPDGWNETADGYVEQILESGNHLLGLIDQVLDLSKIEAGKLLISLEPVNSRELLSSVVRQAEILAQRKDVEVSDLTGESHLPDVIADESRARQALMNLASNAIKYNRPGGKAIFRAERRGRYLRFSVEDTGKGIAASKHAHVFEPFNRLGAEKSGVEGTGVGLALTKELVEQMGGLIDFESRESLGSTFWIDLVISRAQALPGADRPVEDADGDGPGKERPIKVLYVEDHDLSRVLVSDALGTRSNLVIETARTSEDGLAKAIRLEPNIIIVDVNLPDMDGFTLLAKLRQETACKNTPVIALTADAMPEQVRRGLSAGFARYLTKPVDLRELETVLAEVLEAA
ncbi:MAG: ATP-binding protein [Kiloniellales bacterium]|nr:ATP-binding protein [Kiloniellales bacterium]